MDSSLQVSRADLLGLHNLRLTEVSIYRDLLAYPPLAITSPLRTVQEVPIQSDLILLDTQQVKRLHDLCLAELAILRDVLGFDPIPTGKQMRRQKEMKAC